MSAGIEAAILVTYIGIAACALLGLFAFGVVAELLMETVVERKARTAGGKGAQP